MKLRKHPAVWAISAILVVCAAAGLRHDQRPQQRPHGVPAEARWVAAHTSADEAGAYFDCSSGLPGAPVNQCTVWNDTDGSVRVSGRFVLRNGKRAADPGELQYVAADSHSIYLNNGDVLERVN